MRVSAFDWDLRNIAKVEAHDLGADDVEWLFAFGKPALRRHAKIAGRYIGLGFIPDNRFVLVVFDYNKRRHSVRVVTAYEPTEPSWRIRYEAIKRT